MGISQRDFVFGQTAMPTILKKVPFDADLLPLVHDFDCAEKDPPEFWEEEINE
jgi:hypothetical protein